MHNIDMSRMHVCKEICTCCICVELSVYRHSVYCIYIDVYMHMKMERHMLLYVNAVMQVYFSERKGT